jgi:hypothetical protein
MPGITEELAWYGPLISKKVERAAVKSINRVMGECVEEAQTLVHVRYGFLQGSLRFEPAHSIAEGALGTWGSFDINYALWQEVLPPARGGKPYMRPSADHNYPHLAVYIREAL